MIFFFSSSDFGKFKILDEYILSKNTYVFTVLDSNSCDLPRHAVMQSFKSASVSVQCSSWFLFLCSDSSGAVCFQGTPVSVCTCLLPDLWSLPITNEDILFPVILTQRRKAFWSLLSHFQTLIVLLPLWAIFRTLATDLCPCVTIAFGGFFELCWALLVIPHTARLPVLNCVIILDLPSLFPFLRDICRFKWNVSPREAILVKV